MATQNRKELIPFGGMARITHGGDFNRATANLYLLQYPNTPDTPKAAQFKDLLVVELKRKRAEISQYGKDAEKIYCEKVLKTFGINLLEKEGV